MYEGKLVFSQLMDNLPQHTFRRCAERFGGDRSIKSFCCQDQFRCMAFAQLTYRDSLRDAVTCLNAQQAKLNHMGIRGLVRRSTLADANERRDWRLYAGITVTRPSIHIFVRRSVRRPSYPETTSAAISRRAIAGTNGFATLRWELR